MNQVDMHGQTEKQKEVSRMQGELIHIFWGYHSHRLRTGFSYVLGNPLTDEQSIQSNQELGHSNKPCPAALQRSLHEDGYQEFNLRAAIQSSDPVQEVTSGIIASMWDSLSHVTGHNIDNVDTKYSKFVQDPELQKLRQEMDELGKGLVAFSGSRTLHAGLRVGVGNIAFLYNIEHQLPPENPFKTEDIAFAISKADSTGLSSFHMDQFLADMRKSQISDFVDQESHNGFSRDKMKKYCDPNAIGCSARAKIGVRARSILEQHDMYVPTYTNENEQKSAIQLIGESVKDFLVQNT